MGLLNKSTSTSSVETNIQQIDNKTAAGERSIVVGAGGMLTNPEPERVLAPVLNLVETVQRSNLDYQLAVLEAEKVRTANEASARQAEAALAAKSVGALEQQRSRETGALEQLLSQPLVLLAIVALAYWGRR